MKSDIAKFKPDYILYKIFSLKRRVLKEIYRKVTIEIFKDNV